MRLGNRKLHPLIGPDGPPEHPARVRVFNRPADEEACITDAFRRDQDAFGIHAVDDVTETFSLFAHQCRGGNFQIVEKNLATVVVDHRVYLAQRQAAAARIAHVQKEHRHPIRALRDLVGGRCAGQQEHQIGFHGTAGPDLLSIYDITAGGRLLGAGLELGRVTARGRLGDTEGLKAQRAACDTREISVFLLF